MTHFSDEFIDYSSIKLDSPSPAKNRPCLPTSPTHMQAMRHATQQKHGAQLHTLNSTGSSVQSPLSSSSSHGSNSPHSQSQLQHLQQQQQQMQMQQQAQQQVQSQMQQQQQDFLQQLTQHQQPQMVCIEREHFFRLLFVWRHFRVIILKFFSL